MWPSRGRRAKVLRELADILCRSPRIVNTVAFYRAIIEREKLVTGDQEADCKRSMNTFAFVGDLDKSPEVSCVYHSEEAENQFMRDPKGAVMGDGMQPRKYDNKAFR